MKISIFKIQAAFLLSILFACAAFAQQVKLSAFPVKASTLLEEVRNLKAQNPKWTPEEFADNANKLLATRGFNFLFDFDSTVCQKIAQARQNPKNAGAPIRLNARLDSFDGEATQVVLPESQTAAAECGACSVALPMLEIGANSFVTIIENRNIKFHTPPNFAVNEVFLVEAKAPNTIVRRWNVPYRSTPLSISEDGKILFLELPAAELQDLALSIYDNGALQFFAKSQIDADTKATPAPDAAKQANAANFSFFSYGSGEKMKILKFATPCR